MPFLTRVAWFGTVWLMLLATVAWAGYRLWPRRLDLRPVAMVPECKHIVNKDVVILPARFLVVRIGNYDDEFLAYLMFTYLRGRPFLKDTEVLLTYPKAGNTLAYAIELQMPNDLLASMSRLFDAEARGWIGKPEWRYLTADALDRLRYETQLVSTAYNFPPRHKLEDLSRKQLVTYLRRFIRFKSLTDPRIRGNAEPVPHALTSDEAHGLAEDIMTVAGFYGLPLDFFLGIGAMENNYMDVPGDLLHTVWKARAEKGDVVLQRKRGRVVILNCCSGVWQITRQTLRYAHRLYSADHRDYSLLPAHLRPPADLDVTSVRPEVLTTYAGLLFRDLLDQCAGDVEMAVGAYNGGLRHPNRQYAAGVQRVAEYARRVMERAAVLNGPAAGRRFMSAGK